MEAVTVWKVLEKYSQESEYGFYHNDSEKVVFVSDWWKVPSYVQSYIDRHFDNYECRFYDEISSCSDCGKFVDTNPDCYGWLPDYFVGDGFLQCKSCAEKNGYSDYIQELIDDPTKANTFMSHEELEAAGFEVYNCGYETGWHHGQNDNPKEVLKQLQEENSDLDYLFSITSTGQFDINWCVYCRKSE